jgi:hypothetical protein
VRGKTRQPYLLSFSCPFFRSLLEHQVLIFWFIRQKVQIVIKASISESLPGSIYRITFRILFDQNPQWVDRARENFFADENLLRAVGDESVLSNLRNPNLRPLKVRGHPCPFSLFQAPLSSLVVVVVGCVVVVCFFPPQHSSIVFASDMNSQTLLALVLRLLSFPGERVRGSRPIAHSVLPYR